ncbi:MAG TPA: hypothetical protein DCK95_06210 [Anaerolineaceae bacterium]|nr:hypothetical protein [Anaerolineaceae bacterium]
METSSRQIRVFISSTFRDMQAERDHLVKFIFPQLRKQCEQRGVSWSEVDLRWGITSEQSAEGQVLPICLEEIQRCKPYFIGLLGERYGWVPDTLDPQLIEREPWLKEHQERSVTELEILHGVLNDPEMAGHALFYFRDPASIQNLAPEQRKDFLEEASQDEIEHFGKEAAQQAAVTRKKKLQDLKERIRTSSFPVKENFHSPHQLGEWVLQDLGAIIDQLYPEGSQPSPLQQEFLQHEAFARSRCEVFVGGEKYFNQLDAHTANGSQPLLVIGDSGSGKSALLANWGMQYRSQHPDEMVLLHFIGASATSSDWTAMLRRIMAEIQVRFSIEGDIPDENNRLRTAFPQWLQKASVRGKLVLVLDALNQLEDKQGAQELTWLPEKLPNNVRLIASALPGKSMEQAQKRGWKTLSVQPLDTPERERLINEYLAQFSKQLNRDQVQRIAGNAQCGNPLALRILLDELRQFGIHEELDTVIEHYLQAGSIPAMVDLVLARCESDFEGERPHLVKDALSYLWAARNGLTEAELLDLLGSEAQPLPHRIWSPLYLALESALFMRGGLLAFFHDHIRRAVEERYLPTEIMMRDYHQHLANYFTKRSGFTTRKLDELPWQLAKAQNWQELYDLLSDVDFFQALWEHDRFDLKTYWATIEANSDLRRVDAYRAIADDPLGYDLYLANWLALLYQEAGDLETALQLHQQVEHIAQQMGFTRDLAASLINQGLILKNWGQLDKAMALFKEHERICRQEKDESALTLSLGNQALILKARGELDAAMQLMREEEQLCRRLEDSDSLQKCLGNQGLIHLARREFEDALLLLKEQERLCRQIGNLQSLAICLGNQGAIQQYKKDFRKALELNKEEENLYRQIGDLEGLGFALGNQALLIKQQGDLKQALDVLRETERIFQQVGNINGLCNAWINQGFIHAKLGDKAKQIALLEQAYTTATQKGLAGLATQIEGILNKTRLS